MASRTAHALLPTLIALAVVPAPAAADWSPPQAISSPGADTILSLGFDHQGHGTVGWSAQPGRLSYTATLQPGGRWAAPRLLPRAIGYAGFELRPYASSRTLIAAKVRGGEGRRVRYRIAALDASAGDFGRFAALDSGRRSAGTYASRSLSTPVLAVNARGDAIAAWMRYVGGVASIRVAERNAGRPFSRRRTIGRTQPFRTEIYLSGYRVPAAVAIDERGNRVVAWYHGRRIKARIHQAGGGWGPVRRIGRAVHPPPTITAAASRGGFIVAWGTLAQSKDQRLFEHAAALRPAGGGWTAWRLERFATAPRAPFASAEREVATAFDSNGQGVAAWTGTLAGHAAVKLAIASERRFAPTQVLSGAHGARLGGLAAGPAGKLAVSWREESGEQSQTMPYARVGSRGEGFSPAELVGRCSGSLVCGAGDVKIAFDRVSAQPTAVWVERTDAGPYVVLGASRR